MLLNLIHILETDQQKIRFTELFIQKLQEYGYGTLSKNDLQDLLIYCFDEASGCKFLDEHNNYQLAKCLKTTDASIKKMRMNISQKYYDIDSRQQLLKLFKKIAEGEIKLEYNDKRKEIYFGVENNVVKRELETLAKELGHTLNSKRNREIVVIKMDLFLDIVEYLNANKQHNVYDGIIKNENNLRKEKKQEEIKKKVFENIVVFSKDVVIGVFSNLLKT